MTFFLLENYYNSALLAKSLGSARINTFIQQGCMESIRSDSKDFYIVTKYFNAEKSITVSSEISSSRTFFNIDNNKKYL